MSWPLFTLLLAAFAIVAASTSAVVGACLPGLDRATETLAPRHRARAWLLIAATPALLAGVTVFITLLPALGLDSEHCLAHSPHHVHLCLDHVDGSPSTTLLLLASMVVARGLQTAFALVRALWLSATTARTLREGSEHRGDVLVFEAHEPQAFVLGVMSPRVHASRGLFRLSSEIVAPVIAHERAHARNRDPLWRALCPMLAAMHLPCVANRIARRLAMTQEMAADAEAARELGDPARVAASLLALARLEIDAAPGLAFTHGDIEARVHALVGPSQKIRPWAMLVLTSSLPATIAALAFLHAPIHHTLESILGALS